MLTDINWNEKRCNFDDVDDICKEFSNNFLQISRAYIPSKTLLIHEKDKPWFSNEKKSAYVTGLGKPYKNLPTNIALLNIKKNQRNKVSNIKKSSKGEI